MHGTWAFEEKKILGQLEERILIGGATVLWENIILNQHNLCL